MMKVFIIFLHIINFSALGQNEPTPYCKNYINWLYYKIQIEKGSASMFYSLSKMGLTLNDININQFDDLSPEEQSEFAKLVHEFQAQTGFNSLFLKKLKNGPPIYKQTLSTNKIQTHQSSVLSLLWKSFMTKLGDRIKISPELQLDDWDHFVISSIAFPTQLLNGKNQKDLRLGLDPIVKHDRLSLKYFNEFKKECPFYDYVKDLNIKCQEKIEPKQNSILDQLAIYLYQQENLRELKPVPPPVKINYPFAGEEKFKKYSNWNKVEYATRPYNMITTLIFHHTETASNTSVYAINRVHRNKPEGWLMIAYNYTIQDDESATINEARPPHIKGGHAGTEAVIKMKAEYAHINDQLPADGIPYGLYTQHLYAQKVQSGEIPADKVEPEKMPRITKDELYKKGGVSANALSMGIAIIGSYTPDAVPSHPNELTVDQAARLACHLQFKYPNIKTIGGHRQYNYLSRDDYLRNKSCQFIRDGQGNKMKGKYKSPGTGCPGNILLDTLYQIQAKAREYDCQFEVNTDWVNYPCDPKHETYYGGGGT
ncbi:MAG: N-acetylmuramoyl-L-alanine amidase [Bacteriovoracaceae bacterium]|nr:N-acetylmuramoyl-L-alanine amidase [Bacteriovoracaceae bacterium]